MRIGDSQLGFLANEPSGSMDFSDDSDDEITEGELESASILGSPP